MSDTTQFRPATEETPLARVALIGVAVLGVVVLVFAPLLVVFAEATAKGVGAAVASLGNRDALSAIKLTLLIAAISVPLNAAFGIAAAWFITKFDFRGKAFLITLIDLPFSVSPVVAGLCIVLMFGANSLAGGWLVAQGFPIVFALPGIALATMFVTFPFVARELIPVMIEQGRAEEEAALTLGASRITTFRRITLPLMLSAALPGLANLWLIATKDTALLAVVGFGELTQETRQAAGTTKAYFTFFMAAGMLYLTLSIGSGLLFGRSEKWARRGQPEVRG